MYESNQCDSAFLGRKPSHGIASGGVTRTGGDTGPLKIMEDRGLRGAALRGALAPDHARGRQAVRVGTPIPTLHPITQRQSTDRFSSEKRTLSSTTRHRNRSIQPCFLFAMARISLRRRYNVKELAPNGSKPRC